MLGGQEAYVEAAIWNPGPADSNSFHNETLQTWFMPLPDPSSNLYVHDTVNLVEMADFEHDPIRTRHLGHKGRIANCDAGRG